jgi:hypothetical protein
MPTQPQPETCVALEEQMSSTITTPPRELDWQKLNSDAQRWVRRKRILYTILGIYTVLSLMWFAIDMADGTESL